MALPAEALRCSLVVGPPPFFIPRQGQTGPLARTIHIPRL